MGQVRHGAPRSSQRGAIDGVDGQVERMNRTIKDATVKRFRHQNHDQLRTHLADFLAADTFARRLKTLGGHTPYEHICKIWSSDPDQFILEPIHLTRHPIFVHRLLVTH